MYRTIWIIRSSSSRIPRTNHRTRARSELLNISPVLSLVKFCTALPVSIAGCYFCSRNLLRRQLYADLFSQAEFTGCYPCRLSLCKILMFYLLFFPAEYEQIGYFQRLLVTFILRIRIKTSMRAYCGCVLFRCWGDWKWNAGEEGVTWDQSGKHVIKTKNDTRTRVIRLSLHSPFQRRHFSSLSHLHALFRFTNNHSSYPILLYVVSLYLIHLSFQQRICKWTLRSQGQKGRC